jgi:hypothetical protein
MVIVVIAAVSILLGIIMRLAGQSLLGIFPNAFLRFADTCLLLAIALAVVQCLKEKK